MFYKITFEANVTYYFDKNLYTEEQALDLADKQWSNEYLFPDTFIEVVEEEGE